MTPTQRTLALLRAEGYTTAIVEHWNPYAHIRQDLFGFGDILAIKAGCPPLLVQTTTGPGHSARLGKILSVRAARVWLQTGSDIEVISWSKTGARGKRKTWTARREMVTLSAAFIADAALP